MSGILLPAAALAGGADVSDDVIYSDDVTVTTVDGDVLDINGDGHADLAIASNLPGGPDSSRYYLGNGDGTFGEPVLLNRFESSEILAVDLNGDMIVDLVQGRRDQTSLFYLGNGTGVGTANAISADTDRVLAMDVGDLDGDGDLDLVTGTGHAGGDSGNPLQPNRFYLNSLMQNGTVTFTSDVIPEAEEDDTRTIALADMDGDTKLDVIVGNDETTAGSDLIYLNQSAAAGDVTFAAGFEFGPADDQNGKLLIGDLDNDGDLDIVTLNFLSTGMVLNPSPGINRFFLNKSTPGNLAFDQFDISAEANMSSGGALADFDGDGDLDIAVADLLGDGQGETITNRLYLNQLIETGSVTFVGSDISPDEHQSRELAAGDINGDGHIDIIVGNQAFNGLPGRDRRYLNNGTDDPFTNVAPVIEGQAASLTTAVDTALTIELDDLTVTDPDNAYPEDFTLTVEAGTNYTVTADTTTITPAAGFSGNLAVPVTVNDGTDASASFELCVNVGGAGDCNNPPSFTSTPVTDAIEGEAYTYDVTASDDDTGDTLAITVPVLPAWLTLMDNGDGTATLTGTPAAGDAGNHAVSLQVSDGSAAAEQDFNIAVATGTGGNNPPEFTSTAVTAATEDAAYTYDITADDDTGATLTITAPTLPGWLTLTDNSDGTATLTGTPAAADVGDHDVSLEVSDENGATDTQNFTITVEAASAPPPPPPPSGGGGGGGSLGILSLLALFASGALDKRRRRLWHELRKQRCPRQQ